MKKYVLIILFIIIAVIAGIRLLSPEDDWICNNGIWIKHGNPSAPQPQEECK